MFITGRQTRVRVSVCFLIYVSEILRIFKKSITF